MIIAIYYLAANLAFGPLSLALFVQDDSEEDDGHAGGRGPMKRAARHSVDVEVCESIIPSMP